LGRPTRRTRDAARSMMRMNRGLEIQASMAGHDWAFESLAKNWSSGYEWIYF